MTTHETKAEHDKKEAAELKASGVSAAHQEYATSVAERERLARARNVHEDTLETKAIREDIAKLKGEVDAIKAQLAQTGPPPPQPHAR